MLKLPYGKGLLQTEIPEQIEVLVSHPLIPLGIWEKL
jgi:hypothetical protein